MEKEEELLMDQDILQTMGTVELLEMQQVAIPISEERQGNLARLVKQLMEVLPQMILV